MSRLYSVTLQNESLPLGFNIVTVPGPDNDVTANPQHLLERLGLRITETIPLESPDASARLMNLVTLTLWGGHKRNRRDIEREYEQRTPEFLEFVNWVAEQPFVPVESSPVHGESLDALMNRGARLMGFASFMEGYGLVHHDPVICIVAIPVTVIIGASVGAGEAMQERIKKMLGGTSRKPSRKK